MGSEILTQRRRDAEWMSGNGQIQLHRCDCVELMRGFPDKHFDLAIVDPPYGIGAHSGIGKYGRIKCDGLDKQWDHFVPSQEYFSELFRVSKNQIIWGGNYFDLPQSRCFAIWDKGEGFKDRDFAECEQAWCSFDNNAAIFKRDPLASRDYIGKIHPTQKPVALYSWLLSKYAQPGQLILDTHFGSASLAIAAHRSRLPLIASEIDADYFAAAVQRIERELAQSTLEFESPRKTEEQTAFA